MSQNCYSRNEYSRLQMLRNNCWNSGYFYLNCPFFGTSSRLGGFGSLGGFDCSGSRSNFDGYGDSDGRGGRGGFDDLGDSYNRGGRGGKRPCNK